jgi:hypothetical protein
MDPSDLRAGLAERLVKAGPIDAETFNAACFMLSRALDEIELSVDEAKPLVRHLLRVVGRVVIDTGTPSSPPEVWSNTKEMTLQWIGDALADFGFAVVPREDLAGG